jgi:hypothetical protein
VHRPARRDSCVYERRHSCVYERRLPQPVGLPSLPLRPACSVDRGHAQPAAGQPYRWRSA